MKISLMANKRQLMIRFSIFITFVCNYEHH